ncbi:MULTISPECIES: hypothetical protein [unclassified Arenibacter]|uniref:hypothetical protein n=1 Tax=unclassified Arenibacter TaxID=2615047 RepID=UPI000E34E256|nr:MULTISPECIES: hypothetical protein [unclassified Arenibacter]MCM4164646.1 hypothetical protein [Arenibacter sp. A80]RFT55725.1 hypothetical protein D0S24_13660 [Arenibacter sp. P308M17]
MEKRIVIVGIILLTTSFGFGQHSSENWTENELAQYSKLTKLANYVYKKDQSEIPRDSLFKYYIYFDNILNDTVVERKEKRIVAFDNLFSFFRKTIDSIGVQNLDAKPVRFYKNHKIYEPFNEEKAESEFVDGEKMYTNDENVFAYFKKEEPENPLGVLLFDPETNKLLAWILINQPGYSWFLTFNLM